MASQKRGAVPSHQAESDSFVSIDESTDKSLGHGMIDPGFCAEISQTGEYVWFEPTESGLFEYPVHICISETIKEDRDVSPTVEARSVLTEIIDDMQTGDQQAVFRRGNPNRHPRISEISAR